MTNLRDLSDDEIKGLAKVLRPALKGGHTLAQVEASAWKAVISERPAQQEAGAAALHALFESEGKTLPFESIRETMAADLTASRIRDELNVDEQTAWLMWGVLSDELPEALYPKVPGLERGHTVDTARLDDFERLQMAAEIMAEHDGVNLGIVDMARGDGDVMPYMTAINTGDMYNPTIAEYEGRLSLTTQGDVVEYHEQAEEMEARGETPRPFYPDGDGREGASDLQAGKQASTQLAALTEQLKAEAEKRGVSLSPESRRRMKGPGE